MKDYTCKDTWCHTLAEYDSDYCEQHEDLELLEEKALSMWKMGFLN